MEIKVRPVEKFAEFAKPYKADRFKFWHLVGTSTGSAFKRFFVPFRNWDAPHVIGTDVERIKQTLADFDSTMGSAVDPEELAIIALAAKNRAEIISARSDFYPVYSAILALCLTVIAIVSPEPWMKFIAGAGVLFFVFASAVIRIATREQVSYLKEVANVIEHRIKYPKQTCAGAA